MKKSTKIVAGIVGGVVVLGGIGAAAQSGGHAKAPASPATASAAQAAPETNTQAQQASAAQAAARRAAHRLAVRRAAQGATVSGYGAKILTYRVARSDVLVAKATHSGSSNFIVELVDPSSGSSSVLFNVIGAGH